MGCNLSRCREGKQTKQNNDKSIEIENPLTNEKVSLCYSMNNLQKEDYLMNIMNAIFFQEKRNSKVDISFQSLYCQKDDRFHYYLFRLMNVEIENLQKPYSGKMWVLYLHDKPLDWDNVINTNMKVDFSKGTPKIAWKFEKYPLASPEQMNLQHQLSQKSNLSYLQRYSNDKNNAINISQSELPTSSDQLQTEPNGINKNQSIKEIKDIKENHLNQSKTSFGHNNFSSPYSKNREIAKEGEGSQSKGLLKSDAKLLTSDLTCLPTPQFNQDFKGKPNIQKISLKEISNTYYSNSAQRIDTEEGKFLQVPVQTEAIPAVDNFDPHAAKLILGTDESQNISGMKKKKIQIYNKERNQQQEESNILTQESQ